MKLIYIDESGNTGNRFDDPLQPYHLVSGLIIDEKQLILVENNIRNIAYDYFGNESKKSDFEFHGYEIHKGKGYFKKLNLRERIELLKTLLNVIKTYQLNVIYTLFDKQKSLSMMKFFHPHQISFMYLVQKIEEYLSRESSLGLLVADENPNFENHLIAELEFLKMNNVTHPLNYNKLEHIVDSIHFVKSNVNWLIQLADVVAYVLHRGIKVREELQSHYKKINGLASVEMSFTDWVESKASFMQKTDLAHFELVDSKSHTLSRTMIKIEEITK